MIGLNKAKPYEIPKTVVWEAWKTVKSNGGSCGIDGEAIEQFEANLKRNLYKIWNRLSSGCYIPPAVKRVEIPKRDGSQRPLGIPTVSDRVAQTVVKQQLEPLLEEIFHASSFGYRPKRSAHGAIEQARKNCWKYKWVLDVDIKGFFDNMPHDLLIKAVEHVTENPWVRLYIKRWLEAEIVLPDGKQIKPGKGTPQGGVVSPLLANLFLHYAHDKWLQDNFPDNPFERYADDILIHCRTKNHAITILNALKQRLQACGLEMHPVKTKIVCCETKGKQCAKEIYQFNFLGHTFQRRLAKGKNDKHFTGFLPAISKSARKDIVREIRSWRLHRWGGGTVEEMANKYNPIIQGWLNYYGKFYKSEMNFLWEVLNTRLMQWFRHQHKEMKGYRTRAYEAVYSLRQEKPRLFAHWRYALVNKVK
jgi:RNA-directed DNA polymerase